MMLLKRTIDNSTNRGGAPQLRDAGRSPAENLGLRVQAAILVQGLGAQEQIQLAHRVGLQMFHLTQLARGKLPMNPRVETRLTQELHIPAGYLAGHVTYGGEPIAAEVRDQTLSLPPWMLLLGESLVANAALLAKASQGLSRTELMEITGYSLSEVDAMWNGRDSRSLIKASSRIDQKVTHVPSLLALQRLKAYLLSHGKAADGVLSLVEMRPGEASEILPPPKVKARGPKIVPLLDQLAAIRAFSHDKMALPISWSPVLSALEKAATDGELKLNNRGSFTGNVVADRLHALLEARGYPLPKLVDDLLAEGHVRAFLQTDMLRLRKQLQRRSGDETRAISVGLMVALLAKLQVGWKQLY